MSIKLIDEMLLQKLDKEIRLDLPLLWRGIEGEVMKIILLAIIVITFCIQGAAQQKHLYLATDDHTDYMWTANAEQYDSAFVHQNY